MTRPRHREALAQETQLVLSARGTARGGLLALLWLRGGCSRGLLGWDGSIAGGKGPPQPPVFSPQIIPGGYEAKGTRINGNANRTRGWKPFALLWLNPLGSSVIHLLPKPWFLGRPPAAAALAAAPPFAASPSLF